MNWMVATMQTTVLPSRLNLWLKRWWEWVQQWHPSERLNFDTGDRTAVTEEGTRPCTETTRFEQHDWQKEKSAACQWQNDIVGFSGPASMWLNLSDTVWIWFHLSSWHPTPVLSPGESHGWRSLVGCSPWGREELDTTERLHFHFSLSCIGEGNGNALQYSCLENPRDGGAWWAAVYGVAKTRTRLKRLSSSSNFNLYSFKLCEKINIFLWEFKFCRYWILGVIQEYFNTD